MRELPLALALVLPAFASAQTIDLDVSLTQDDTNWGFTFDVTVRTGTVVSATVDLGPGAHFDTVDESHSPATGNNNDGINHQVVQFNTWPVSGDIDGSDPNGVIVTIDDGTQTYVINLFGTGSGPFTGTLLEDGSTQPVDFETCAESDCTYLPYSTLYTFIGDDLTLKWVPDASDLHRRDRMFYFAEVLSIPAEIQIIALQTAQGEEELFWAPATSGHYHVKVMACDPDLIESGDPIDTIPSEHCSDWADSINDENTPVDLPGWMVYAAIRPPTGGGIE